MIRAFVAAAIDPDVMRRIAEAQTQLKPGLTRIRWVQPENLHLTLKFLGAVKEEDVAALSAALELGLARVEPFRVVARGIGVFPDIRKPRVLWVGLQGEGLESLAAAVERLIGPLGFAPEKRAFQPHLTIGRWREGPGRPEPLKKALEQWKDYDFGASWIKQAIFFQSVLKPDGAVYSPLRVISLSQAESDQGGMSWT